MQFFLIQVPRCPEFYLMFLVPGLMIFRHTSLEAIQADKTFLFKVFPLFSNMCSMQFNENVQWTTTYHI